MSRIIDASNPVKPASFAHFVVRASNLDDSIAWYEKVLGMKVQHRADFIAFLTYDDEHHRLAIAQAPTSELPTAGSPGVDHVAYTLSSLEDLLSTYVRLKQLDILPVWPINHGLTTSLYYADPDGIRIEFQVENYATKSELNAYMHSSAFADNPIGVNFDADKLLARFENGDSMEELIKLGSAPA